MTREEIEGIAEEAAEKAVAKVLIALGIPAADPLKAQAIFLHLERNYDACQTIKGQGLKLLVRAVWTVAIAIGGYVLLAFGFKGTH